MAFLMTSNTHFNSHHDSWSQRLIFATTVLNVTLNWSVNNKFCTKLQVVQLAFTWLHLMRNAICNSPLRSRTMIPTVSLSRIGQERIGVFRSPSTYPVSCLDCKQPTNLIISSKSKYGYLQYKITPSMLWVLFHQAKGKLMFLLN
jgi:hypothetical protein